jgi:hypothetical protein
MTRAEVDLCIVEPGHEVDLFVDADLAAFSRVWLGEVPMRQVIREGGIKLSGARDAVRDFPSWLLLSTLAAVPRPEQSIQRRWLWTPPLLPRREAVSEERANSANGEKEKPRDPTASICQSGVSTQPLEDGGFSWRRLRQLPSISQSGYLICTR